MKKIISIILAIAMLTSMVACGDSSKKEITALSGKYECEDSYFTFSKDGSVTLTGGEETFSGTYVLGDDRSIYFSGEITNSLGMFTYKYEAGADVIVVKMEDYTLAKYTNANGKQIKNAGLNGQYVSDDFGVALDFSKDGTLIMCGIDSDTSDTAVTGTYFLGDDNDIYVSSDFDELIGMYGFVYQENADAIVLRYEDYVMATFTKSSKKIDISEYTTKNISRDEEEISEVSSADEVSETQAEEETLKIPTTDEVIAIAKKHATWIDDWFLKNKYAIETGWDCYGPIEESESDYIESYKNGDMEWENIDIPEGSFVGSCGAAADTSGWSIYRFAYIKTQDGYEIVDLYRQDESDASSQWLEDDAYSKCSSIINAILTNPSNVYYLSTDEENCIDFDYSKLGTRYRFYFDNSYATLCIHPSVGYAYCNTYDEDTDNYVDIPLMVNFEVVDIFEN